MTMWGTISGASVKACRNSLPGSRPRTKATPASVPMTVADTVVAAAIRTLNQVAAIQSGSLKYASYHLKVSPRGGNSMYGEVPTDIGMTIRVGSRRKNRISPIASAASSAARLLAVRPLSRAARSARTRSALAKFEPLVECQRASEDDHEQKCREQQNRGQRPSKWPVEQFGRLLADRGRHHERAWPAHERWRDDESERRTEGDKYSSRHAGKA